MNANTLQKKLRLLWYVFAVIGIASVIYSGIASFAGSRAAPAVLAQTDPFLDRRINQIEQRFYTIESRINRLEQQSALPGVTPRLPGNNDIETRLLRSQVETLQLRVAELECAALRLDERTLTEAVRRARRESTAAAATDRCRLGVNEPLKLSARP